MVDHNVMRFYVAVHNAFAVAEIEGLEQLVDVESNIEVVELGIQASEVGVVDVFKDERGCLALPGKKQVSARTALGWLAGRGG